MNGFLLNLAARSAGLMPLRPLLAPALSQGVELEGFDSATDVEALAEPTSERRVSFEAREGQEATTARDVLPPRVERPVEVHEDVTAQVERMSPAPRLEGASAAPTARALRTAPDIAPDSAPVEDTRADHFNGVVAAPAPARTDAPRTVEIHQPAPVEGAREVRLPQSSRGLVPAPAVAAAAPRPAVPAPAPSAARVPGSTHVTSVRPASTGPVPRALPTIRPAAPSSHALPAPPRPGARATASRTTHVRIGTIEVRAAPAPAPAPPPPAALPAPGFDDYRRLRTYARADD